MRYFSPFRYFSTSGIDVELLQKWEEHFRKKSIRTLTRKKHFRLKPVSTYPQVELLINVEDHVNSLIEGKSIPNLKEIEAYSVEV
jgi:hypothetical protein